MNVIMTGGGTGGHIYPAIAIADKIMEKHPEAQVLFVGTEKGLERELVPKNGYAIKFITVSGFNRKKLLKNIKVMADLAKGDKQARRIIKEFKPDVVIGTGGYVCGPVVRAAKKMGIKCFIHEQNAYPGLTNKLLEKYVDKVFLGFTAAEAYFKKKDKLIFSGNPVREKFFRVKKNESREKLGICGEDFALLCFGGSRGASRINAVMLEAIQVFNNLDKMQIFFVTGKIHYKNILNDLKEKKIDLGSNIHILEYIDEMDCYLSAADVVISRAGALTIAEIAVCGKPAVLIPSPNVTGNHQFFNAKAMADLGGAILIEEKNLKDEELIKVIMKLENNQERLLSMSAASKTAGAMDAAEIIYNNLGLDCPSYL